MVTSLKRSFELIPFKSDQATFIKNPLKKLFSLKIISILIVHFTF